MPASINDKFTETTNGGRPIPTELQVQKSIGAAQITVGSTGGWAVATAVHFIMYKKDGSGNKIDGTQTDWKGIVLDASTIGNLQLRAGTDDIYPIGSVIVAAPTAAWADDVVEGIAVSLNQDGTMKPSAVKTALGITGDTPPDWTTPGLIPTVLSQNGQRETVLNYPANASTFLQPGTRVRIGRTSTAPTQSAQFVLSSSQYASKSSPAGMTFTDDFTCEAWVYLDSYGSGSGQIMSRRDGTQGWAMRVNPNGTVEMYAANGNLANFKTINSYQAAPLNRWFHIAATLDMSSFTAATNKMFIDGAEVPALLASGGTNPTSLVQAGNLAIGAVGSGSEYLNGKVSNARAWSSVRTPQQIRDNMNIVIPGAATSLVANFSLNGTWNDVSGNNNHLSAVNGATNTFASSPLKAIEYGVITNVGTFSGGVTPLTVYTGNANAIPSETLASFAYSSARSPFGFPSERTNWQTQMYFYSQFGMGLGAGQWGAMLDGAGVAPARITVPIGKWDLSYEGSLYISRGASNTGWYGSSLSTSTTAPTDTRFNKGGGHSSNVSTVTQKTPVYSKNDVTLATQTNYYLVVWSELGGASVGFYDTPVGCGKVIAECAYI